MIRNVLGHRISASKICYNELNTQLTIETLNVAFETCGHGSYERFPPQIWFWQLGKVLGFEMILHFGGCHWVDFVSWLNASQTILKTEEGWGSWKIKNWGKLRHRDWILGQFFLGPHWSNCSFQPWTATFPRPIAGVSCLRAERRPQPAQPTLRYGATWLMACMCLAGATPVTASVCNAPPAAERAAAVHGFAEVTVTSTTCNSLIARRKEDGLWLG